MSKQLPPSPPPLSSSSADRNSSRRTVVVLSLIGVLFTAIFGGYHGWLAWRIHRLLAEFRAAHEPMSLAELDDYYTKVPVGSNAALPYGRAFELIKKSKSSKFLENLDELPSGSAPLPAELRESIERTC